MPAIVNALDAELICDVPAGVAASVGYTNDLYSINRLETWDMLGAAVGPGTNDADTYSLMFLKVLNVAHGISCV